MKIWLKEHQQLISQQVSHKILPHAILVQGVTGAGKLELTQWLIEVLACQQPVIDESLEFERLQPCGHCKTCLLKQSNTYPDHLNLIAEKNSLGIDEIRFANNFLQKTAQLGHYKTVLIEHSEKMTVAAANALLKTLEEPSPNSIIILLSNDIDRLLPTIVSRVRVYSIRPSVGENLLTDLNKSLDNSAILQKNQFSNLTQLPELTNEKIQTAYIEFKSCYLNYLETQQHQALLMQLVLENEHSLRWLEQITVNLQRELCLNNLTDDKTTRLTPNLLNELYKVILNGCKVNKTYIQANHQFVCDKIILSLDEILNKYQ